MSFPASRHAINPTYQAVNYMLSVGIVPTVDSLSADEVHDFVLTLPGHASVGYDNLELREQQVNIGATT